MNETPGKVTIISGKGGIGLRLFLVALGIALIFYPFIHSRAHYSMSPMFMNVWDAVKFLFWNAAGAGFILMALLQKRVALAVENGALQITEKGLLGAATTETLPLETIERTYIRSIAGGGGSPTSSSS
jgi:hypothetical protein